MILGNTHGETRTLIGRGDPSIFSLTWETLQAKLEANSPFMGTLDRGEVIAAYRKWYPAVLAGRRVLRRDHRVALVARPGDRGRAACRAAPRARRRPGCFSSIGRRRSTAAMGRAPRPRRAVRLRQRRDRAAHGRHRRRRASGGRPDEPRRASRSRAPAVRTIRACPRGPSTISTGARRWCSIARPRGGRPSRRRTPLVRTGALCPARHVSSCSTAARRRAGACWPARRPLRARRRPIAPASSRR